MIVADDRVARFVADKLGFGLCPPWTSLGIERGGEIVGGIVWNCFEGASVHVTVAGTGWTRSFLKAAGEYAYGTLGVERVTITTESDDVAALGLRLGGKIEGVLRSHFGKDRDAVVIGILRDEWLFASVTPDTRG